MSAQEQTYPLTCCGPGPHEPADGVLGTTSVPATRGVYCDACRPAQPTE